MTKEKVSVCLWASEPWIFWNVRDLNEINSLAKQMRGKKKMEAEVQVEAGESCGDGMAIFDLYSPGLAEFLKFLFAFSGYCLTGRVAPG